MNEHLTDQAFSRDTSPLSQHAKTLLPGEKIRLENNALMNEKVLSFRASLDSLGQGKITVGHGKSEYGATYAEIDGESIRIFSHYAEDVLRLERAHGLKVQKFLSVKIDTNSRSSASVTLTTENGSFLMENVFWEGRNGAPFCEATGVSLSGVTLSFDCRGYRSNLFAVGDSYFNLASPARWPYYLTKRGDVRALMIGYPGMNSGAGLEELKKALSHGTPEKLIWCLGMNDPDSENAANPCWLSGVTFAEEACKERGIELILSTIPNVPERSNMHKNAWVRASGYRYIDFARAVGAEEENAEWYEGMLCSDKVHPTELGAKALCERAVADCPELMQ